MKNVKRSQHANRALPLVWGVLYAAQQRTRRKLRECTARRYTFGKRAKSSLKSHKTFWLEARIDSRIGNAMLQSLSRGHGDRRRPVAPDRRLIQRSVCRNVRGEESLAWAEVNSANFHGNGSRAPVVGVPRSPCHCSIKCVSDKATHSIQADLSFQFEDVPGLPTGIYRSNQLFR